MDHDKTFADTTARRIQEHGLADYAQVIFAPLITHTHEDLTFLWYDLSRVEIPQIDFLLIDGPPGHFQPLSRYGALPLLQGSLSSQSAILLDDTNRVDEQILISRWLNEFPLEQTILKAEKGAVLLTFKPLSQPETEHEK